MISSTGFISDTILFLRSYLASGLTDPLSRSGGFIMTSYPKNEVQYPIVTIRSGNTKSTKLGLQSPTNLVDMNIEIRTWCRNSKEGDVMTGSVINILRDAQFDNTSGTSINGIYGFILQSNVPIIEEVGDNTIHSHAMSYNYKAILTG